MNDQTSVRPRHQLRRPDRFFFGTRGLPCPYLPDRTERKVVTDLSGPDAAELYERLSRAGFRRSHSLAYRPACPGCEACVPVRIPVAEFKPSASFARITKVNASLVAHDSPAHATIDQFRLFSRYQRSRHAGGEMSGMTYDDYRAMVEETPVDSRMIEYRNADGVLVAAMLADRLADSLSAVYSFFDPALGRSSLGIYMVLWLIESARTEGLPFVYLGYWIADSRKMSYKTRFRPIEALGPKGWTALDLKTP
jgi:arginyl-tRNA--protein-N-Asp/Glu arginylyltransferase